MSRYKILDLLGRGGMGAVYRARQTGLKRDVAIKFLLDEHDARSDDRVTRFKREMDALIALSHPGIVKILDAGLLDGKLFYVMELLAARDLEAVLKTAGPLPPDRMISILDQMLDALDYVHEKGLVHRDIKPSNILVDGTGRAILTDFGLVRKVEGTLLTADGHVPGTARFLSPEQLRGEAATPASDLWSLGVTTYELVSGKRPFEADGLAELAGRILHSEPPALATLVPGLPPRLTHVVDLCLRKKPDQRWPGARAARGSLNDAGSRGAADSHPRGGSASPRSTARRIPVRNTGKTEKNPANVTTLVTYPRSLLRPGLVLAVAGAALAAVFFTGGPGPSPERSPGRDQVDPTVGLMVRYAAGDRLVVDFSTTEPSVWTLERTGTRRQQESAPRSRHVFEIPVSPWEPSDRIRLSCDSSTREVEAPPSLGDWIRRLHLAVTLRAKLRSEFSSNQVWNGMVKLSRGWTEKHHMTYLQEYIKDQPQTLVPLAQEVSRVRASEGLTPALEALRSGLSPALRKGPLPKDLREKLLVALQPLDELDCLSSYAGQPGPFGIQALLGESMTITATRVTKKQDDLARGSSVLFPPIRKGRTKLTPPDESFRNVGATVLEDTESYEGGEYDGVKSTSNVTFTAPPPQDTGERTLLFKVVLLGGQSYLLVRPPGWSAPLPVRFPDGFLVDSGQTYWLEVTLRGALIGPPGLWSIQHARAIRDTPRVWCIVEEIRTWTALRAPDGREGGATDHVGQLR